MAEKSPNEVMPFWGGRTPSVQNTGGGSVTFGTTAGTACEGNDARLSNARTPTGHHATHEPGGTDVMAVDAAAATGSLRTLGSGAAQACAGNDSRLSNARTPTAHAATHQPGGTDAMAVDAAAATGSLRTLGTGAAQACVGNDSRLSDARTPTAHALESAGGLHTASGLTAGWVLRATGAATFAFQALVAGDIPNLDAAKLTTGTLATARIPHITKHASANVALAASTTINATDLDIAVLTGEVWVLDILLPITVSGGVVGLKPIFTLPASSTGEMTLVGTTSAATASTVFYSTTPGTASATAFLTASQTGYIWIRARIVAGANGTIRIGVTTGASAAGNILKGATVMAMKE